MANKEFNAEQVFSVGDVVQGLYSNTAHKILTRIWVEEIAEYRYILQYGEVKDNKFVPRGDGKVFNLCSTKEIREKYSKFWTADKVTVKKGDVFKDESGDFFVVEDSDGRAWSLKDGTWAKIKEVNGKLVWSSSTKVTEVKTIIGHKFSKFLG